MALTRRQREIFEFIRDFVSRNGYSPSLEEIGSHFGLSSVATVHKHVQHLVEKGFLQKAWNRSRSVEPVEDPGMDVSELVSLPVLGIVAAGVPIEAIEDDAATERISVPPEMVTRPGETFVLRVRGESMIDEQIRDGDYIVVSSQETASDGQMVVALVGGDSATVKKIYREPDGRIRLQPANPSMAPIVEDACNVQIQGVVVGVIRKY